MMHSNSAVGFERTSPSVLPGPALAGPVACRGARTALLCSLAVVTVFSSETWAASPKPYAPETGLVLFRDATLIDSSGGPEQSHMNVLVRGERIERVFSNQDKNSSSLLGVRVVPLGGRFIMPGLIDAHVHLATPPNRRQAEAIMRRDLYGGVTAVRDMADDLRAIGDLARASLVGEIAGPDIYYAALMAGPEFFTDTRTALVSAGGIPGKVPWMHAIDDHTELPIAVAEARGTYATAIKLYAALTPDLATRITNEAHKQHMLVWAHGTLYPARPSEVVAAGVDVVSHACLLVREPDKHLAGWSEPHPTVGLEPFRGGHNPALDPLFVEMARRGTILDATVWAYRPETAVSDTAPTLPPGSCDDAIGGAITGQAYRAGVPIDAGTDNVADWQDPWPDLFHELTELATQAGMPNLAILQSATLTAARAAGQEKQMGSIEPGKLANFVVLDRDPVLDLQNLRSVFITVKRGRIFERSAFVHLQDGDITDR